MVPILLLGRGSFLSITVRTPGDGGTAPISPIREAGRGEGRGVSSDPSTPSSWGLTINGIFSSPKFDWSSEVELMSLLPFPGNINFAFGYKPLFRSFEENGAAFISDFASIC